MRRIGRAHRMEGWKDARMEFGRTMGRGQCATVLKSSRVEDVLIKARGFVGSVWVRCYHCRALVLRRHACQNWRAPEH
jgi:hypothetical protein